MVAEQRREEILTTLRKSGEAVSASALADRFKVSRQVIVGDVALLRAAGEHIEATPRGYMLESGPEGIIHQIAVSHTDREMEEELNTIVDQGCEVLDVTVEHPIYGQLTGALRLRSRYDVGQFLKRCRESDARPLSELTGGIHLHTILCPDEEAFERVKGALRDRGFLLEK